MNIVFYVLPALAIIVALLVMGITVHTALQTG